MHKDIAEKKAEVYDLIMQQQALQNQLQALNQVINQKVAEINKLQAEQANEASGKSD